MAISVVRKAQSAGGTNNALVKTEGETATAGNLLIAFAAQSSSTEQIKFSDDTGSTGWTNNATKSNQSTNSGWMGWKVAVGGEKEIIATPAGAGTISGVSYIEASGLGSSPEVDSIVAHNEVAAATEHTTTALTTAEAEELIFAGICFVAGTGTVTAWTGTGVLNNVGTASTRVIGGHFVTASKWTANTAIAHWTTSRASSSLIVAFKAGAEGGKVQAVGGTLSFAGTLPRATMHQLPAGLTFAGTLPRFIAHALTASLSFAGALQRNATHVLTASLSFLGVLPRNTRHGLTAALSFLGELTPAITGKFVRKLTAVLSFEGTLPRRTVHQLAASLTPAGTLQRAVAHPLQASVSFAGVLPRAISRPLTASLSFAGSLPRRISHGFKAGLSFLGNLVPHGEGAELHPAHIAITSRPAALIAIQSTTAARITAASKPAATITIVSEV